MKRLLTPLLLACILAVLCLGSCIYETDKKIAQITWTIFMFC